MGAQNLKDRTKKFGLRVLNVVEALPNSIKGRAIGGQLIRSGMSVGANYRAVCRARSKAEFVAKLGTVIEEADESAFWLEIITEGKILDKGKILPLWREADELVKIMTASRKTAQKSKNWRKEKDGQ